MKIQIKNGRLIDPKNRTDAVLDLFIADGKILATGKVPAGFVAEKMIDASGLFVIPGMIDLAARLREPGYEYRATLESEMSAAVAGGITSLACPPDTDPALDEPGLVEMLKHRARALSQANVYPVGALTYGLKGQELTEMAELADAGCVAFSQADAPLTDTRVLMRAMQYAATFDFGVWLRPQDSFLARDGVAHDGEVATRLGLPAIPVCAETIALATMLQLARKTGVRLHVCRISSAESVAMIREAKKEGLALTCDVSMNHIHLSEMDIGFFDSNCHLMPPLRNQRDRDALRNGLLEGVIDAMCSNHSPVDEDAKQLPFAEAEAGATGLELLLPLLLKWAQQGKSTLLDAIAKVTVNPARILNIDAGHLSPGVAADICIFDPERYWKVEAAALKSQGKNTPFIGMELQGKVRYTLVNGQIVYQTT
ncbi:MAG: dihydroorotase [Gallionellales bacterium 35-53-114]|jgi:dihydroorotase|nr:MAG: dihydroorotase [Gallionellales bacterium 35-53-114]OYZ63499.1 MAG: dihydroorotase [Gallionellales bacterium 24-53-125]OZB10889.1 MAG: dihydroorotase [Gallionellales bacterium 39-52-133]HQS58931.1 dihydroorotase [Gallionellaceae bacterium]HQS75684.1 dihydroorotase [Gallionellaceae bacterium]